jgi:hypothetical protein
MSIDMTALLTIQVHPDTRRRAIVTAGNDLARIERLLNHARDNHLNRTEQWYWEKILYNLERDCKV